MIYTMSLILIEYGAEEMNRREIKELKDNLEAVGLKVISIHSKEEIRVLLEKMEKGT